MITRSASLTLTSWWFDEGTAGHLMVAASGVSDSSLIPSWMCPMICTCSVYVPGQTLIVSFGPDAFTAAWIVVKVACGQSPSRGVLSTQNVVPDDGGSGGPDVVSLAPTTVSAMPAAVVSSSPSVTSGAGRSVDVTTLAGSTRESGSFCRARACPASKARPAASVSSAKSSFLFIPFPLGPEPPEHFHWLKGAFVRPAPAVQIFCSFPANMLFLARPTPPPPSKKSTPHATKSGGR